MKRPTEIDFNYSFREQDLWNLKPEAIEMGRNELEHNLDIK
tara:strand:+ start:581 stop:703 length:123 start_codon:yes stop_codon:yes gene_type:complete